jgi:peptidoglycan hydrolase CwlO-like protein
MLHILNAHMHACIHTSIHTQLEQHGGQTARRRELETLKDQILQTQAQRAEKDAHIAEMQQIILNREDEIEAGKKEHLRLRER